MSEVTTSCLGGWSPLGTERRDDHAAIARRLDALESRAAALEAREPA